MNINGIIKFANVKAGQAGRQADKKEEKHTILSNRSMVFCTDSLLTKKFIMRAWCEWERCVCESALILAMISGNNIMIYMYAYLNIRRNESSVNLNMWMKLGRTPKNKKNWWCEYDDEEATQRSHANRPFFSIGNFKRVIFFTLPFSLYGFHFFFVIIVCIIYVETKENRLIKTPIIIQITLLVDGIKKIFLSWILHTLHMRLSDMLI